MHGTHAPPERQALGEDRLPALESRARRLAGPGLLAECRTLGGCATGDAKITSGYRLPARYVIHTVGPVWHGGGRGEPELLASCYRRSFRLAAENGLTSIAFPAISCGVYGYPLDQACAIALHEARKALADWPQLERVVFVPFGAEAEEAYRQAMAAAFP